MYRQVQNALQLCAIPEHLCARDKELTCIEYFLKTNISNRYSGSLYISGSPGTGKTASILELEKEIEIWSQNEQISYQLVYLNCMRFSDNDPKSFYPKLLQEITKSIKPLSYQESIPLLESILITATQKKKMMYVVIADEIDQLVATDIEILYKLFEWPKLRNSKLILIGIANALDLTDRFLPILRARNCEPQLIHFKPYSWQQIVEIVQQRLEMLNAINLIEPSAIQLCARRVAKHSGDIRKALDCIREAFHRLECELRIKNADLGTAELLPRVSNLHVAQVLKSEFDSPFVETIRSLPIHQQLVLCALTVLKHYEKKDPNLGQIRQMYTDLCKKKSIPPVTIIDFSRVCDTLTETGLLGIKDAKEVRLKKVNFKVQEEEIREAMEDVDFLAGILAENLTLKSSSE